jgi:ABC-type transport system involved in cytochrome c biogenesis permease subunit
MLGLLTGMLAAQSIWGSWWVWDAKHTTALLATLVLIGIALSAVLTRLFSNPVHRQVALSVLLLIAVAVCAGSFLVGVVFPYIVHPRWFPEVLTR